MQFFPTQNNSPKSIADAESVKKTVGSVGGKPSYARNHLIQIAWIMATSIAFVSDSHEECDTVLPLTDLAYTVVPDPRFRNTGKK